MAKAAECILELLSMKCSLAAEVSVASSEVPSARLMAMLIYRELPQHRSA